MQRRIFFNIVVVLLLGVFISGVLSARIVKRNLLSDSEKNLTTEAGLIRELLGESLINNSSNIDIYVNKIKQITDSRITIVDAMGNVIIDTDREYTEMENHAGRPEIAAALRGEAGSSIRYSSTLKVDFIYVAQPILKGNSIIGAVRMSKPLYEIKNLLNNLYINILIAVLTGIIASSLLGYKMAMNITKPVKEITYTASRISKGQFDRRINLKDRDEIGILADSINDMAAKLNETITSLQDKNIKLESIMSSMINGIIAVDNSEEILFINPVAESLLGITDREVTGKHILQVVRNNSIDNYLKKILMNKEFFSTEVNFDDSNEKILKLYANPIKQNGANDIEGIIITIQDVTELRKLERIRTEFIANVSHELKTPLTSIKGFAETLKSFDFDDRQDAIRFLNIIEDEAERLYRLINDILSLSELEQRKTKALRDKIDIEKAVEEVLSVLKSQSDKKNIRL
ncbi:MAG TPA: histidine kinase dimerization/phospho-acceptor domain-containing protein, partial [Bacillota bacterium]|nr:histidine kinase dimerization/phospho-acceptor domain-containing protein [Bacillota bacterium]